MKLKAPIIEAKAPTLSPRVFDGARAAGRNPEGGGSGQSNLPAPRPGDMLEIKPDPLRRFGARWNVVAPLQGACRKTSPDRDEHDDATGANLPGRSMNQGVLEFPQAGQEGAAAKEFERTSQKQSDRLQADCGPSDPETIKNDAPATAGASLLN